MYWFYKLLRSGFIIFLVLSIIGLIATLGIFLWLAPGLPTVATLKEVHLQVPLRVYSREGDLLAEYGEKRRKPMRLDEIPEQMKKAFLAAEDDRFFEHPGVDYQGLLRATLHLIRTGEKGQGGSTITMQLARNFFLTRERTYTRKLREIFLALKIEKELTKEEILELYLNKIYLGNRSYGVGAAAEVYYGVAPSLLTLAQIAMIAGLPKAPSAFNPIANPERANVRRNYVLGRMLALGFIAKKDYDTASQAPITASLHSPIVAVDTPYVGEMVRSEMIAKYGNEAYTLGLRVFTTISTELQQAATKALTAGLLAYDRRHGFRGPIGHIELSPGDAANMNTWDAALARERSVNKLRTALVLKVDNRSANVYLGEGQFKTLPWEGLSWAHSFVNENQKGPQPKTAADILRPGDIIYVSVSTEGNWRLAQIPQVTGALVSLDPKDGAILALLGGFDFNLSKFNRATQAKRQPGSNFKPFIYSAALERGFTPASIINDAPVVFNDAALEDTWRPENYSGKFFGPTRLRVALTKSRNLVSIRLLYSIGIDHAVDHVMKFGFEPSQIPNNLSLALGTGLVTPLELASGYAVFANGGYRIYPYFIDRIVTAGDEPLFQADPHVVCEELCQRADSEPERTDGIITSPDPVGKNTNGNPPTPAQRVISATNAYQIVSMMRDVITRGTGRKAKQLGRSDLSGKTGTTNDQRDAWFSGYNSDIVATVWVGFDKLDPLGSRETGAKAALPIWIDYMRVALKDSPEHTLKQPDGMVTVRIDPDTGLLASSENPRAIFETFRAEDVPARAALETSRKSASDDSQSNSVASPEHLF
jgi:penicillin-binding protein 1A